jgi:hypothetical protein
LRAGRDGVSETGETARLSGRDRAFGVEDRALEAVFESLGRVCVQHLVAVPHPLGLPPRDRLVAKRWLSRHIWKRDLMIVLAFVAAGLAAALAILSLGFPAGPPSDAVQKSTPQVTLRG